MTVEAKTRLAAALDLADDYLRGGYSREKGAYVFPEELPAKEAPLIRPEPALPPGDSLEILAAEIRDCKACPLHRTRKQAVPGNGSPRPLVLILGDVPETDDEEAGKPFAGKAGELLDRMLAPIALSRGKNCFLSYRVKCRPLEEKAKVEEIAACAPFLRRECTLLKPIAVLNFERKLPANPEERNLRPLWGSAEVPLEPPPAEPASRLVPELACFSTYHPALLLKDGDTLKRPVWERLKALSSALTGLDRDYDETLRNKGKG
jgi:uracil-DNA glycosylase family 4